MLANLSEDIRPLGSLSKDAHRPETFIHELIDFIANELPRWRDRPDRKTETAETGLTSQLCAHLNSAARHADGWDVLQFRTEETDVQHKGRKIDLVPAPCGVTICIEGRSYTDFDPLLPIECKRLPTPKDKGRDEREYVISQYASTGGIQRFKDGHHGSAHIHGAMIGYVQEGTTLLWYGRVAKWITDLAEDGASGWRAEDQIHLESDDRTLRLAVLRSSHERQRLPSIEIRHLWLEMN